MPSQLASSVTLFSALSADAAWAEVVKPWFERAIDQALRRGRLCAVIAPTRGLAVAWKNRALEEGMSLLGVRFWLPGELREELEKHFGASGEIVTRDVLQLVTASVAEEIESTTQHAGERQVAGAIARVPEAFLRAYDQLDQAGWDPLQELPGFLRGIGKRFSERVATAGFQRLAAADRALVTAAKAKAPPLGQVLLIGFDGMHWPQFQLLLAGARSAEQATVVLTEPREEARNVDSLWIGSWEQEFSACVPVSGEDRPRPMAEVLRLPESKAEIQRRGEKPAECIDFLVGETIADLAKIIAARVLQDLASSESPRIAVVFPRASALSRLVSLRLADAGVPHNDGLGHPLADSMDDSAWTAWLRVQDDRRVGPFQRFLEECRSAPNLSVVRATDAGRRLSRELGELLIDDLSVLAASLSGRTLEPLAEAVAAAIRDVVWLPERAEIGEMYALTLRAFAQIGWHAKAIDLRRAVAGWIGRVPGRISRRFWLHWLAEVLAFSERQREPAGRHPYARVQLIAFADAALLEWSHVILAGLNEGAWPITPDDDGWLSEPEIAALNANARALNADVVKQGRHGEGHESIRSGHTWCLTVTDGRGILQRQFLNLMENASEAVTATAAIRSAEDPERIAPVAEFFTRLYFCARGRAVSPGAMAELRSETARWLQANDRRGGAKIDLRDGKETRRAWDIRRKAGKAFGEYEFALRSAPSEVISLPATAWERALRSPAHAFLELFLGVSEPDEVDPDFTARAIGTWAHRWLAKIGGTSRDGLFRPLLDSEEMEKIVRRAAVADRQRVESLLEACGRSLPDWWGAVWDDAVATATTLVRKIPVGGEWTHCATEFRLGSMSVAVRDGTELRLSGQIDLLLAKEVVSEQQFAAGEVWIVDYKTGDPKALKATKLAEGDGLQLALYGLAVRARGAASVQMSRIGPSLDLSAGQLSGEHLDQLGSLWQTLVAIQETGRLGMLGPVRSPYGPRVTYPLATLPIDEEILEAKWTLTHFKLGELGT